MENQHGLYICFIIIEMMTIKMMSYYADDTILTSYNILIFYEIS